MRLATRASTVERGQSMSITRTARRGHADPATAHESGPPSGQSGPTRRTAGGRRRALAALGVGVLAALGACTSSTPAPSPSPTPDETTAGPTDPGPTTAVEVYFVVDTRAGFRLARELRTVSEEEPGAGAVEAMLGNPVDPDYATTWNPDTTVLDVTQDGSTITVDLSEDARTANVGSEGAALMIQQLVYTASAALDPAGAVELLIEGEPAGELWGAVEWTGPVERADPLDVRAFVQIDTPTEGAEVNSPVTVSGEAAAFEANVPWRVLDQDEVEVEVGFTMTSEGQTFAPFSFSVELDPGTYIIEISEDDPSDGEGGTPMTDTKTVTVR